LQDRQQRDKLIQAARQHASEHYDIHLMVERYAHLLGAN
jgi:hypothetical protein